MIDVTIWMENFLNALIETFGERVWFVGLQGSYARGEATETSDIDPVVILDTVSPADIRVYSAMLDTLPHRELVCGFFSGKEELLNWEPSDLFQFYYDNNPVFGSLDALLPLLNEAVLDRAIRFGACNIYHGCVHNMLHGNKEHTLRGLYKSASFVVQAVHFRRTGNYLRRQEELLEVVSADERVIVETFPSLKSGGEVRFQEMSETLFHWAKKWINLTGK